MKADLHIHSNNSDGSDTVQELLKNLKKSGVDIFALTDHDTIEGCKEMEKLAPENITFIKGVELTCLCGDIKCHILGYGVDINNPDLLAHYKKQAEIRGRMFNTENTVKAVEEMLLSL